MQNRIPYLDSAKGLLIMLVVFGRVVDAGSEIHPVIETVFKALYLFHMPAFVILAGMTSRDGMSLSRAKRLLIPYFAFQILYFPLIAAKVAIPDFWIIKPFWSLWFLVSLFLWRLILPALVRVKYPMSVAILIAIAAGFLPQFEQYLSLNRTLYFLPAFVYGHFYAERHLKRLRQHPVAAISGFVLFILCSLWAASWFPTNEVFGYFTYAAVGDYHFPAPLSRFVVIGAGIGGSVVLIAGLPARNRVLEYLGSRSLEIYLLHGLLILPFEDALIKQLPASPVLWLGSAVLVSGVVLGAATLASNTLRANLDRLRGAPLFRAA